MKISYAITVCNEHKEITKLLNFLFEHKRPEDQVVVQMDKENATEEVWDACERYKALHVQPGPSTQLITLIDILENDFRKEIKKFNNPDNWSNMGF